MKLLSSLLLLLYAGFALAAQVGGSGVTGLRTHNHSSAGQGGVTLNSPTLTGTMQNNGTITSGALRPQSVTMSAVAEFVVDAGIIRTSNDLVIWLPTTGSSKALQIKSTSTGSAGDRITIGADGTVTSWKACATNYTRVGPNFCRCTSPGATPCLAVTLTRDTCTTTAMGVADAKAALVYTAALTQTGNTIADRNAIVTFYTSNTCATAISSVNSRAREFTAVAVGASILSQNSSYLVLDVTGGSIFAQFTDDSSDQGLGTAAVHGYYD